MVEIIKSPVRTIDIAESISKKLRFRDAACTFFKSTLENSESDNFRIDFRNIQFMSRSFAHEYLNRKEVTKKNIKEVNMPKNVKRMFQVVRDSDENSKLKLEIQT